MKRNMYVTLFILVFLFILLKQYQANGIPSFSRKYRTSCATCHYAFPKLNAFGEAFRRNGYQFPGGQEETMVKEKPVSLGAEAYKRVWPDAIWPGSIPGTVPLAVILENEIVYTPKSSKGEPTLNFEHLMGEMEVLAGGTIGENISFLAVVEIFSQEGVEIEMGQIAFNNLVQPNLLNIEVGQIPPEVLFITNHRRLGPRYWITTRTVGDNEWSLEESQKGIEAYGILKNGRVLYNLGLVEGRGNVLNSAKDVYTHLAVKLGGLRYDGITEERGSIGPTEPWVDNSVQVGGFIYLGKADLSVPGGYKQRDSFKMLGADFNFFYKDLNLLGGFSRQRHNKPFVANPGQSAEATNLFLEAHYVIYPWLIPTLRYERFELRDEIENRLVPTLQALFRANLRAFVALEFEKEGGEAFKAGDVEFGLVIGF